MGKHGFYVDGIKETFDMDGGMFTAKNHKYNIFITNRQYALAITLNRKGERIGNDMVYRMDSSDGHMMYIRHSEIKDMDVFIDKLALVGLGNFK